MKIAVLGGFGLMAEAALHDLAAQAAVTRVYAADLSLGRAKAVLSRIPNRKKIVPVRLDLTQTAKAARKLKGAQVVLNCSWYEFNLKAMELALALKAHYVDLGGLYHMTLKQLRLSSEFRRAQRLAVLGCGSTPGITNMMVARMEELFDRITTVGIYDASYDPTVCEDTFLPPFSIRTLLDEYVMPAPILLNGRMTDAAPHSLPETLDFDPPIGRVTAGTVIHSETATLPEYLREKGIKNLYFKIVYPEAIKRQLAMLVGMGLHQNSPVRINGSQVSPRMFVTALAQLGALQPATRPRDFEVLRVRIEGSYRGRPKLLVWDCEIRHSAKLTAGAIGVGFAGSIAALQLLRGQTKVSAGAGAPESILRPAPFFTALKERRHFSFSETVAQPLAM